MYYLGLLQLILALLAVFLVWQGMGRFWRMRLLKQIASTPLPKSYARILSRLPQYRLLPESLKERLHLHIRYFIKTKEFRGVGLEVTEEMQVVIAFFACLLQLGREECYENLHTIIVYPSDVITRRIEDAGDIYREGDYILEGESAGGSVVIAWNEAKKEAMHPKGHNVIIHEMAHEVDFEDGAADGVPPLAAGRYAAWAQVMYGTFRQLKKAYDRGRYLEKYRLIGPYAATNEVEFFAVTSELFFQRPVMLQKNFPKVYGVLRAFYGLDTAEIFGGLD